MYPNSPGTVSAHPSEVVSVGNTIHVFVKDFDPEKKRISLGYKKPKVILTTISKRDSRLDPLFTAKLSGCFSLAPLLRSSPVLTPLPCFPDLEFPSEQAG